MNKKGFTLVELLAVIVVLGLLITIAATKGFGAFDNSKKAINSLNEKAIKEAINVLSVDVKQCSDEDEDYKELNEVLGVEYEDCDTDEDETEYSNGCECLKHNLKKTTTSIVSIPISLLKEKQYISGSDIDLKDFSNKYVSVSVNSESGDITFKEIKS